MMKTSAARGAAALALAALLGITGCAHQVSTTPQPAGAASVGQPTVRGGAAPAAEPPIKPPTSTATAALAAALARASAAQAVITTDLSASAGTPEGDPAQ